MFKQNYSPSFGSANIRTMLHAGLTTFIGWVSMGRLYRVAYGDPHVKKETQDHDSVSLSLSLWRCVDPGNALSVYKNFNLR